MRTEKGKTINADNYVGGKTKIESARIEEMKHGAVIRLASEVLEFKGEDELPDGKELRASRIFGLGKSETDGSLIVIKDSKLEKFLKQKNVSIEKDYELGDSVEELIGIPCIIQKTDDGYLDLV